jgi:hypothetical protein
VRGVRGRDNHRVHLRAPQQGREIVVHGRDGMALRLLKTHALASSAFCA